MNVNPSPLFKLATAYWESCVLLAANRIKLFSVLGKNEMSLSELADRLHTSVHSTELFLNACASMGLLEKKEERYKNTVLSENFLVEGAPAYLGDALKYSDDLYHVWGKLEDTLRSGEPVLKPEAILGEDPAKTRNFVMGMHNRAIGVGRTLAERVDLKGRKRLLDVGGGPATYSILLAQKNRHLTVRVMDLPKVVEIAREIIREFNMEERIHPLAGDYLKDPFPSGNDCILNSGTFHRETAENCKLVIEKSFHALESGGMIIINDVFCNKEKDGPPFVMLFGINMMLTSIHGTVHSIFEVSQWLAEAGFTGIVSDPLPPPMPHTIIKGEKP